jgi:prophage antirepressor-like protein
MTFEIMKNQTMNCELKYVLDEDNEIWFRGKTIADILGYKNNRKAMSDNIDDEDKCKLGGLSRGNSQLRLKGNLKNTIMINESGLYSLILSSKLKTAKAFKKWVTKDVLPSIRKTGTYSIPTKSEREINLEERRHIMDEKRLKMEEIDFYRELAKDDDCSIASVAKDEMMAILTNNKLLTHEECKWARDITELCKETLDFVPKHGQKIYIGKLLVNEYTSEFDKKPQKLEKWVVGSMRKVNAYPKVWEPTIIRLLKKNKKKIISKK